MKGNIKSNTITIVVLGALLYLFLFTGCKSNTVYVPVESVRTEYRDRLLRDSVHLYDSVYIKEKGDSVILEKYKYIYRDRLRTDTILKTDSIAVPYAVTETREVKVYPRWLIILACLGSLSLGVLGFRIFSRIKK